MPFVLLKLESNSSPFIRLHVVSNLDAAFYPSEQKKEEIDESSHSFFP